MYFCWGASAKKYFGVVLQKYIRKQLNEKKKKEKLFDVLTKYIVCEKNI